VGDLFLSVVVVDDDAVPPREVLGLPPQEGAQFSSHRTEQSIATWVLALGEDPRGARHIAPAHEVDQHAEDRPAVADIHPSVVGFAPDQWSGVNGVSRRQAAIGERRVNVFELLDDAIVLVVKNEAQHVVRRMGGGRTEITGLINEDAEFPHSWSASRKALGGGCPRLKGGPGPYGQPRPSAYHAPV